MMDSRQQKIDRIDRQLFMLWDWAMELKEVKLAQAIGAARSISYGLLPESRRQELSK